MKTNHFCNTFCNITRFLLIIKKVNRTKKTAVSIKKDTAVLLFD